MKIMLNGIHLAYSDQGHGEPLVFLHAFPLHRAMWEAQVQAFAEAFRVITIDLRGFGESDAPIWRYSIEQFADDVHALLDHLSIPRATFVGLSMGGYTLLALYRKYRNQIQALVLADTRAEADSEEVRSGRMAMAQTAYHQGMDAIAEIMIPKLLGSTSLASRPNVVQTVRAMIARNQPSGIIGALIAMADRPDSTALLREITCPTLVIVGEEDIATPPAEVKRMADQIPGARLEVIPSAGHASNLEQPERFNQALLSFLQTMGKS
ncbi:MAG: alpha/beta fold hydrolase [Nitrospirae bacterium]|nr:MAG: alpha/beta fold hydrolase [Nitrospirota bacterium]